MLLMWDLQYPSPYSWIVGIVGPRYLCLQLPQNHSRPHGGRCQSEHCWSSRRGPLLFHRWRAVCYPVQWCGVEHVGILWVKSRYILDMMQYRISPSSIYIYTLYIYIYIIYIYIVKSQGSLLSICCSCCCTRLFVCWHTNVNYRLKALLNRDVAHMYTGTTDVVRGCWFLTPPLRLMLFQTSLCWNLTTNMLNRNDIMLFLCWVSQPVHFTKLRYWQKTVV